jgi:hypothetical protein
MRSRDMPALLCCEARVWFVALVCSVVLFLIL